jgi:SagB-type dehydrogenase family enzyme
MKLIMIFLTFLIVSCTNTTTSSQTSSVPGSLGLEIMLPRPDIIGTVPLETTIYNRRSRREYQDVEMSLIDLGQILWATQGVTSQEGFRTAPSAGALYPLEVYVLVTKAESLEMGIYRYLPANHALRLEKIGAFRDQLYDASLRQQLVSDAPVSIIITSVWERITGRYGSRGIIYGYLEAGHAGQNLLLQASALSLAVTGIAAFEDDRIKSILGLGQGEDPLYLFAIGYQ